MLRLSGMKHRIAIWTLSGVLVAGLWTVYFFLAAHFFPAATVFLQPIVLILVRLTCPIAFVSSYFHLPIGIYWALLANAITYALVGLFMERLNDS
jgi:hypothetical protein